MKCFLLALSTFAASAALAGDALTALDAIKLLPPGKAARIACIEGREGVPEPYRWYLIVQDEFDENGLHEYVVDNTGVVASRDVSQFVTSLTPDDIVGGGSIKVDSSRAARIAGEYAAANGMKFAKLNFELKRDGEQPVWKVTCLDAAGAILGGITLDAAKGTVTSHDGFAVAPPPPPPAPAAPRSASLKKNRKPMSSNGRLPPIAAPPDEGDGVPNVEPAPPAGTESKGDILHRVGGTISHIFGGH